MTIKQRVMRDINDENGMIYQATRQAPRPRQFICLPSPPLHHHPYHFHTTLACTAWPGIHKLIPDNAIVSTPPQSCSQLHANEILKHYEVDRVNRASKLSSARKLFTHANNGVATGEGEAVRETGGGNRYCSEMLGSWKYYSVEYKTSRMSLN